MQDQESRIVELERRVQRLEELVEKGVPRRPAAGKAKRTDPASTAGKRFIDLVSGEGALARLGIALLLMGLVFLVKFGIDAGWLGEAARVAMAAVSGGVLIGIGLRMKRERIVLRQVLMGGGVGSLYIAVYSAHIFYSLIAFVPAILLASLVTLVCLILSVTQTSFTLASVALAAGLATPFALSPDGGSVGGLAAYLVTIQVAAGLVFRIKRWAFTHGSAAVLTVLALLANVLMVDSATSLTDRWVLQGAILAAVAIFGGLPLIGGLDGSRVSKFFLRAVPGPVMLASWGLTIINWRLERWESAGLAAGLAIALVLLLVFWPRAGSNRGAFLVGAAGLGALALLVATDGRGVALPLVIALVLQYTDRNDRSSPDAWLSRAMVVFGAVAMLARLAETLAIEDHTWEATFYDGIGIVAMALCARWSSMARVTGAAAWVLGLLYLYREFAYLGEVTDSGSALVTAAWAVLAIALVVAGLRLGNDVFRYGGVATLVLVVIKLVLFDTSRLDPVWRIVVFAGIGIALLATSWLFPALWRGRDEEDAQAARR